MTILLRGAIVSLALMLASCAKDGVAAGKSADAKDGDNPAAQVATPVEVARPVRGEMRAMYNGTATLDAEADAQVVAKVGGEVRRLLVEEGDRVESGQLLAILDDRQLRLQAAQARAALAKTERDFNRQVELHQKGLVAAGAFEGLKYDLENQRAANDLARLNLSYSEIRAPFAGIVAERHVKLGQELQPGTAVFRVTDPTPLKAEVFVPERELARLQRGQGASVQVDALGGQLFPAVVRLVAPTVDAATATFKVTLEVDDPKGLLKPGMFARVGIVFELRSNALIVPRIALLDTDGSQNVFVVAGGKAVQRAVKTGLSNAGNVEITEGLSGAEQVVVVGQSGLKDGNPVRIVTLEQNAAR